MSILAPPPGCVILTHNCAIVRSWSCELGRLGSYVSALSGFSPRLARSRQGTEPQGSGYWYSYRGLAYRLQGKVSP